jgi:hypothetical protein
MLRGRRRLDVGFPMLGDRIKAEDYWRSVNRHDLIKQSAQIAAEFRAYHSENLSRSWPAAWKTWYVKAVRIISPPKMTEFRTKGRGEFFRAPPGSETCVPLSTVHDFAEALRKKART